ncbi:MAG: hypothetical protein E7572_02445 [Ruminococcaceae bacterium]|jgi:Na+-transporting methylmalonyl-CoA/oxaloacetate decarboxylase gamma subunit|nr:hypothetical protein [Oscillospiraceae bacterium]
MHAVLGAFAALPLDFKSIMGTVKISELISSLWLMLQGMAGIFIVMLIIFAVIVILGKVTGKKKADEGKEQE